MTVEWKTKLFDVESMKEKLEDFHNANLGLAIKLEEAVRDLQWKQEEIDALSMSLLKQSKQEAPKKEAGVEAGVQTVGDFDETLRETEFLIREFRNMKAGNDLMYQQMLQIQQRASKESKFFKEQLQTVEQERDEYLNLYKQVR